MKYMLDTDTFSYLVENVQTVVQRIRKLPDGEAGLSTIACGEVLFGMQKRDVGIVRRQRIEALLQQLPIVSLDYEVSQIYAQIRHKLEKDGHPIGPNDYWIAAHALSLGATLVTNNVREFKRVKGLKVENWL
jgi:tRNA(fMet)-specific endonuclease VapC